MTSLSLSLHPEDVPILSFSCLTGTSTVPSFGSSLGAGARNVTRPFLLWTRYVSECASTRCPFLRPDGRGVHRTGLSLGDHVSNGPLPRSASPLHGSWCPSVPGRLPGQPQGISTPFPLRFSPWTRPIRGIFSDRTACFRPRTVETSPSGLLAPGSWFKPLLPNRCPSLLLFGQA